MSMFKRAQRIRTDADFDNAMFLAVPVEVWQRGELIDYGGPIQRHTNEAVYIQESYYLKGSCEFRIR